MSPVTTLVRAETATDEELVDLVRAGNEDALRELLNRFRPFVRSKSRSYFVAGGDREDLTQEGMIGLYKAIRDFDPSIQPSFRAFANLCVVRQMISAIKAASRHKHATLTRAVPLSAPADDDETMTVGDRVQSNDLDPADQVLCWVDLEQLRDYCAQHLSALEREVLSRYSRGDCYAEIAEAVGRHVKAVDNALQRTKRKLELYTRATAGAAA